ncbi:hypothetical protein TGME49_214600 [Toxoplasma gondii ME49]|uniref:Uncharacterized protein n=1 Tax=Toxoplasma gondii (strain ATCC 50611 / Me49) TaxID=508771 RepID=S8G4F0_TOXGM|nr:hypothetical protein TGME49_214600 [Toxoplasma gondii ME49]EPT26525.1 hypothetical protein TGME49_214600 [Toxoplasma gondii ME49]|eukprot:XP_018635727.1 hypothetical protein TGME49_214600 [Toxoplasma gondii ME49]
MASSFLASPSLIGGVAVPSLGTFPSPDLSPCLSPSLGVSISPASPEETHTNKSAKGCSVRLTAGAEPVHAAPSHDSHATASVSFLSSDTGPLAVPDQKEDALPAKRQPVSLKKGDNGEAPRAEEREQMIEGVWLARGIDVPNLNAHLTCFLRASALEVFNTSPSAQILPGRRRRAPARSLGGEPSVSCETSRSSCQQSSESPVASPAFPLLFKLPLDAPLASRTLFDAAVARPSSGEACCLSSHFCASSLGASAILHGRRFTACASHASRRSLAGQEKNAFSVFRPPSSDRASVHASWATRFLVRFPSLCRRRRQASSRATALGSVRKSIDKHGNMEKRGTVCAGNCLGSGVNDPREAGQTREAKEAAGLGAEAIVVIAFVTADRYLHHVRLRLQSAGGTGNERRSPCGPAAGGEVTVATEMERGAPILSVELLGVWTLSLDVELGLSRNDASCVQGGGAITPVGRDAARRRQGERERGQTHSDLVANSYLLVVDEKSLLLSLPRLGRWGVVVVGACSEPGGVGDAHEGSLGARRESRKRPRENPDVQNVTRSCVETGVPSENSGKRCLDLRFADGREEGHREADCEGCSPTTGAASGDIQDSQEAESSVSKQAVWFPAPFSVPLPLASHGCSREKGSFSLLAPLRGFPLFASSPCSARDEDSERHRQTSQLGGLPFASGEGPARTVEESQRIWARAAFVARLSPGGDFGGWLGSDCLTQLQGRGKEETGIWRFFRRRPGKRKSPNSISSVGDASGPWPTAAPPVRSSLFVVTCGPAGSPADGDEAQEKKREERRDRRGEDWKERRESDERKDSERQQPGSEVGEVDGAAAPSLSTARASFEETDEEGDSAFASASNHLAEVCVWHIGASCRLDVSGTNPGLPSLPQASSVAPSAFSSFSLLARHVFSLAPSEVEGRSSLPGQNRKKASDPAAPHRSPETPSRLAPLGRSPPDSPFPVEILLVAENGWPRDAKAGRRRSEGRSWVVVVDKLGRCHLLEWRLWGLRRAWEAPEGHGEGDSDGATFESEAYLGGCGACSDSGAGCALTYVECISFSQDKRDPERPEATQVRPDAAGATLAGRRPPNGAHQMFSVVKSQQSQGQWLLTDTHLWRLPWSSGEGEDRRDQDFEEVTSRDREGDYAHAFPLPSSAPWRTNAFPPLASFRIPLARTPAVASDFWNPESCRARLDQVRVSLRSLRTRYVALLSSSGPSRKASETVGARWRAAAVLLDWVSRALEPSSPPRGSDCSPSSLCQFLLVAEHNDSDQARCSRVPSPSQAQGPSLSPVSLKRLLWAVTFLTVQRAQARASRQASEPCTPAHAPCSASRSVSPQMREEKETVPSSLADPLLAAATASTMLCRWLAQRLEACTAAGCWGAGACRGPGQGQKAHWSEAADSGRTEARGVFLGASLVWWKEVEREKAILDSRHEADEDGRGACKKLGEDQGGVRSTALRSDDAYMPCALPMVLSYSALPAFVRQTSSAHSGPAPALLSPLGPLASSLSLLRPAASFPESLLLQLASLARAVREEVYALGLECVEGRDEKEEESGEGDEGETAKDPEGEDGDGVEARCPIDEATLAELFFSLHEQPEQWPISRLSRKRVARRSSSPSRGRATERPTRSRTWKGDLHAPKRVSDDPQSAGDVGKDTEALPRRNRLRLPAAFDGSVREEGERILCEFVDSAAIQEARRFLFPMEAAKEADTRDGEETGDCGLGGTVGHRGESATPRQTELVLESPHLPALQRFFLRCMQSEKGGNARCRRDATASLPRSLLVLRKDSEATSCLHTWGGTEGVWTRGLRLGGGQGRGRRPQDPRNEGGEIERTIESLLLLSPSPSWRILLAGCLQLEAARSLSFAAESEGDGQKRETERGEEERGEGDSAATHDERGVEGSWTSRDIEDLLRRALGRGNEGTSRETRQTNDAEAGETKRIKSRREGDGETRVSAFKCCASVASALRVLKSDTSLFHFPSAPAEKQISLDFFLVFSRRVHRLVDRLLSPLLRPSPRAFAEFGDSLWASVSSTQLSLPALCLCCRSKNDGERVCEASQRHACRGLQAFHRAAAMHIFAFSSSLSPGGERGSASPGRGASPGASLDACLSLLPFANARDNGCIRPRQEYGTERLHAGLAPGRPGEHCRSFGQDELLSPSVEFGRDIVKTGQACTERSKEETSSLVSRLRVRVVSPALDNAVLGSYFLLAALAASTDWALAAVQSSSANRLEACVGAFGEPRDWHSLSDASMDAGCLRASSWDLQFHSGGACSPVAVGPGRRQASSPHPALERKNAFSLEADPRAWNVALRDSSRPSSPVSGVSVPGGGVGPRQPLQASAAPNGADGDTRDRAGDDEPSRWSPSGASPSGAFPPSSPCSSSVACTSETSPRAGAAAVQSLQALQTTIDGLLHFYAGLVSAFRLLAPAKSPSALSYAFSSLGPAPGSRLGSSSRAARISPSAVPSAASSGASPLLLLDAWRDAHEKALRTAGRRRERKDETTRGREKCDQDGAGDKNARNSDVSGRTPSAAEDKKKAACTPCANTLEASSSFLAFFLQSLCQQTSPSRLLAKAEASEILSSVLARSPLAEHRVAAHALQIWALVASVSLFASSLSSSSLSSSSLSSSSVSSSLLSSSLPSSSLLSSPAFFLLLRRATAEVHRHVVGAVVETTRSFSLLQKRASHLSIASAAAAAKSSLLRPFLAVLSAESDEYTTQEERFLARCCVDILKHGETRHSSGEDDRFLVKSLETLLFLSFGRYLNMTFPFFSTPSLALPPTASLPPLLLPSQFLKPSGPGAPNCPLSASSPSPARSGSLFPCLLEFVTQCEACARAGLSSARCSLSLRASLFESAARSAAEASEAICLPRPVSLFSPFSSREPAPALAAVGRVGKASAAVEGEVWRKLFLSYVSCGQLLGALEILPRLSPESEQENGVLAILAFVIRARLRRSGHPRGGEAEGEGNPEDEEVGGLEAMSRSGLYAKRGEAVHVKSEGKTEFSFGPDEWTIATREEAGRTERGRPQCHGSAVSFIQRKAEEDALANFSLESLRRACSKRLSLFIDQILFRAALAMHAAAGPAREAYEVLKQDFLVSSRLEEAARLAFLHAASIRASCFTASASSQQTPCSSPPSQSPSIHLSRLCGGGETPPFSTVFTYLCGDGMPPPVGLAGLSLHSRLPNPEAREAGRACLRSAVSRSSACTWAQREETGEIDFPSWVLSGLGELQRLMATGAEEGGDTEGRESEETEDTLRADRLMWGVRPCKVDAGETARRGRESEGGRGEKKTRRDREHNDEGGDETENEGEGSEENSLTQQHARLSVLAGRFLRACLLTGREAFSQPPFSPQLSLPSVKPRHPRNVLPAQKSVNRGLSVGLSSRAKAFVPEPSPTVALEAVLEDLTLCSNLLCCLSSPLLFLPPGPPGLPLPLFSPSPSLQTNSVGAVCVLVSPPNRQEGLEGKDEEEAATEVGETMSPEGVLDQLASTVRDPWLSAPPSPLSCSSPSSFFSADPSSPAAVHARRFTRAGQETGTQVDLENEELHSSRETHLAPATLLVDDDGVGDAESRAKVQAHALPLSFLNKLVEVTRGRSVLLSQGTDAAEVCSRHPWTLDAAEVVAHLGFAGRLADAVELAGHLDLDLLLPFLSFVSFILRTYVIVVDPPAPAVPFASVAPESSLFSSAPLAKPRTGALFVPSAGESSLALAKNRFHPASRSVASLLAAHAAEERQREGRKAREKKAAAERVGARAARGASPEIDAAWRKFGRGSGFQLDLRACAQEAKDGDEEDDARRGAFTCWVQLVKQLNLRLLRVDPETRSHPWLPSARRSETYAEANDARGFSGDSASLSGGCDADRPLDTATPGILVQNALRITGGKPAEKIKEEGAARRLHAALLNELQTVARQFPYAVPSFVFDYLRAASLPSDPVEALGQLLRDGRLGDACNLVKHHSRFQLKSSFSLASEGSLTDWLASLPPTERSAAFRMTFLALGFPLVLQLHARLEDLVCSPRTSQCSVSNQQAQRREEDERETAVRLLQDVGRILADYQKASRMVDYDAASLTALALRPPPSFSCSCSSALSTSSRVV